MSRRWRYLDRIKLKEPFWITFAPYRVCEHCGRPNKGHDKCPHAVDPRFHCPYWDTELGKKLRHIGVES